jgi:hypothetical protein
VHTRRERAKERDKGSSQKRTRDGSENRQETREEVEKGSRCSTSVGVLLQGFSGALATGPAVVVVLVLDCPVPLGADLYQGAVMPDSLMVVEQ